MPRVKFQILREFTTYKIKPKIFYDILTFVKAID